VGRSSATAMNVRPGVPVSLVNTTEVSLRSPRYQPIPGGGSTEYPSCSTRVLWSLGLRSFAPPQPANRRPANEIAKHAKKPRTLRLYHISAWPLPSEQAAYRPLRCRAKRGERTARPAHPFPDLRPVVRESVVLKVQDVLALRGLHPTSVVRRLAQ